MRKAILTAFLAALLAWGGGAPASAPASGDSLPVASILVLETVGVADSQEGRSPASAQTGTGTGSAAPYADTVSLTVNESVSVSDSNEPAPPTSLTVNENVGVSDSSGTFPPASITVNEGIGVGDSPQSLPAISLTVNESVGVGDSPGVFPPANISVNESVGVSDAPQSLPEVLLTVNENIAVGDSPGIFPLVSITVNENVGVSDSPQSLPEVLLTVNESIGVSDTPTTLVPAIYTLTIAITGNGDTVPAPGSYNHLEGTTVQITADPAEGWLLSGWSGDAGGASPTISVVMTSSKTVTANFLRGPDWYVSATGNDTTGDGTRTKPFATMQKAVDTALGGDAVIVKDGTYTQNVNVTKSLTIRSENGPEATTVVAANTADHIFEVTANNVTIRGFTAYGTGVTSNKAAVRLTQVSGCVIEDNYLGTGSSTDNDNGIDIYRGSGNQVINNRLIDNNEGILLQGSDNNMIAVNFIQYSEYYDIHLDYSPYPNGSDNNVIRDNILTDGGGTGIRLYLSNSNQIAGNQISYKVGAPGIDLYNSQTNTVKGNTLTELGYGIRITGSTSYPGNNTIYQNGFLGNPWSVHVDSTGSTNMWRSPAPESYIYQGHAYTGYLGNYYHDYAGLDNGAGGRTASDGVGDSPIPVVTDGAGDSYPLMATPDGYRVGTIYILTLTANPASGGSTNPTTGAYLAGDVVGIAATPAPGYLFVNWSSDISNVADVNAASTTATMNGSATITANFALTVRIPGDVNGDGMVDIIDLALVAAAFGSAQGDPNWNPACDFSQDGVVNIFDLVIVGMNFGKRAV